MVKRAFGTTRSRLQRYLITGVLTVVPIWITWIVFRFVGTHLANISAPWVNSLLDSLAPNYPELVTILSWPWLQPLLAVLITVAGLCALGWLVTLVIGRQIVQAFDRLIARIPVVHSVYGSVKTLLNSLQTKPEGTQRVVLINFPSEAMKTVGLVTRVMTDTDGLELAAVYVPTTPNPTSGYLEIVPVASLVPLDWSMDEAMTFIVSGGAVAPPTINYSTPD